MEHPILEGIKYVVDNAHYVFIDHGKIPTLPIYNKSIPTWEGEPHYSGTTKEMISYVFILDTINFCFWNHDDKKWSVTYKGKKYTGYRGLAAALTRAMEEQQPLANPNYLATITRKNLEYILRGDGELLMMDERVKALNELGDILMKKYNGDYLRVIEEASFDALSLAFVMANDFPSFNDHAWYKGRFFPFLKRAQILAGDIHGSQAIKLSGLDMLTAFADYKLPQFLHAYDVVHYHPLLEEKIMLKEEINAGSQEEIEIRAATIHVVEKIKDEFQKHNRDILSYHVDWILWTTCKDISLAIPHHRTKTIFY